MRRRILLFFYLFLINLFSCLSQGVVNKWLLGYDCCQPMFGTMDFDFSSGNLNLVATNRNMNMNATNGVISDKNGSLLFYSNGVYIANSIDDTMQNGSSLNPSFFTTQHTTLGLTISQANLIIPMPNDSMKYYLFHETIDDQQSYASLHFYYSIIDMGLNNGLGVVVQKNQILLNDSLVPGRITACKHANGRDWWVFTHKFHSTIMYEYLVTPNGIQGPFIQNLITTRDIGSGQFVFSNAGDKLVYYEPYDDLEIGNFDRCSGLISNVQHFDINDTAYTAGAAFSPSGRFLYISSYRYIYQFDLESSNIDSSRITIGIYDGYQTNGFSSIFYLMSNAPDHKIYINTGSSTTTFHVINYPDSLGLACDLCQHCISLPRYNAFTIPNFPNYFLGPDPLSVCDTINSIPNLASSPIESFSLFPNPAKDQLYINHSLKEPIEQVGIINSLGQYESVHFIPIDNGEYLQVDLSSFASGVYYIQMKTAKQVVTKKVVKD